MELTLVDEVRVLMKCPERSKGLPGVGAALVQAKYLALVTNELNWSMDMHGEGIMMQFMTTDTHSKVSFRLFNSHGSCPAAAKWTLVV